MILRRNLFSNTKLDQELFYLRHFAFFHCVGDDHIQKLVIDQRHHATVYNVRGRATQINQATQMKGYPMSHTPHL